MLQAEMKVNLQINVLTHGEIITANALRNPEGFTSAQDHYKKTLSDETVILMWQI